ncbi:MAG: phytanoyl-CoA dioxygenase family protein [Phycisphaerales bacterium]
MIKILESLRRDGFAIVPKVLDEPVVQGLCKVIERAKAGQAVRQRRGAVFAIRNLLDVVAEVRDVVSSAAIRDLIDPVLGGDAFVVRAILFDKTPDANWKVAWHQDASIAVTERIDAPGFGPWSVKAGIIHVRPPVEVLEGMVSLRIHLDDCDESNGALQVVPGSHRRGFLDAKDIQACRGSSDIRLCCVPTGGAMLVRPLIAHASSPGTSPSRRRVIHLEWAATPLPQPLQWHRA